VVVDCHQWSILCGEFVAASRHAGSIPDAGAVTWLWDERGAVVGPRSSAHCSYKQSPAIPEQDDSGKGEEGRSRGHTTEPPGASDAGADDLAVEAARLFKPQLILLAC